MFRYPVPPELFMQSQPTEVPQNEPVDSLISYSISTTQYGLQNELDPSSHPTLQREAGEDSRHRDRDGDASSVSSGGSGRDRELNIRRLRSQDRCSQGGSPVGRVEQYERSHLLPPSKGDGVSFQIIHSTKGVRPCVSVDQFPNGKSTLA